MTTPKFHQKWKKNDTKNYSDFREAEDEIRRLTELAEQLNPKLNGGIGSSGGDNLSASDQVTIVDQIYLLFIYVERWSIG